MDDFMKREIPAIQVDTLQINGSAARRSTYEMLIMRETNMIVGRRHKWFWISVMEPVNNPSAATRVLDSLVFL